MTLPTDVALRATSHHGSDVARLHTLQSSWLFALPIDQREAPLIHDAVWLASDEFDALVFAALHGWYRQALGCLRNAVEVLMVGAWFSLTQDTRSHLRWRSGKSRPRFEQARNGLTTTQPVQLLEQSIAPQSVFGHSRSAWANQLFHRLNAYAHSMPGYNNVDFWESNGPVHRPSVFRTIINETRAVIAFGYLLLDLTWPNFKLPSGAERLYMSQQDPWNPVALAVYSARLRKSNEVP